MITEAERNTIIEQCATAAGSAGYSVRLLKTRPITSPGLQLQALRQAIIDNSHGDGFWIGEILLSTLERETGFKG